MKKLLILYLLFLLTSGNLLSQDINVEMLGEQRMQPIELTYKIIDGDTLKLILGIHPTIKNQKNILRSSSFLAEVGMEEL